ncbi:hypothetical protein ACLB2K_047622 [Fragaria x ananassa]
MAWRAATRRVIVRAKWRVSPRLIGDCRYVALRPVHGESVRSWLGRLAIERCGPLPWRVSPRLVGDCRDVASQSALGWGLRYMVLPPLRGESVRAWLGRLAIERYGSLPWRVSLRLVGDCRNVALPPLRGESIHA